MMFTESDSIAALSGHLLKKYRQKKKILSLLYKNGKLSGPIISKRIGVSLPTVISLLNELIERNVVEIRGTGESRGGRKPVLYCLVQDSIYIIACEIERYRGKIIIYDSHNQPVTSLVKFNTSIDDKQLVDKIINHAQQLASAAGIDEKKVLGIGLT